MNSTPPKPKALCEGIKDLLDKGLQAGPSKELCAKRTALALGGIGLKEIPKIDLLPLIEGMWRLIATNWVEAQCQWRGNENWRWTLRQNLNVERQNTSEEVRLNRTLASNLAPERWANEIPTASGLAEKGGKEPGGLDLACLSDALPCRVCLIELKIGSNNPVSAAFQIVTYGLVLNLARLVHARLLHTKGAITIAKEWSSPDDADLRVLAPTRYYSEYPKLDWFEAQLNEAVEAFGKTQRLGMTFGFRHFGKEPTNESQMIEALDRRVDWDRLDA